MEVSEKKKQKQSCKVNCPLRDEVKVDEKRNMEVMNFNIYFLSEFQEGKRRKHGVTFQRE